MTVLLIYPPVSKPCEPPAGIARLAGTLRANGIDCRSIDLNLSCLLEALEADLCPDDTWSRRALKNRNRHLRAIRTNGLYAHPDHYRRTVFDLNRLLKLAGSGWQEEITLANHVHRQLSPLVSADLLAAGECYEKSRFYPFFRRHLESAIEDSSPAFIGISISYLSQALPGFALLGFLKHRFPQIKTIIGGGLITSWMNGPTWNEPFAGLVDYCCKGPGEQELLSLLGCEHNPGLGLFDYSGLDAGSYLAPGMILPYAASDGCYWKKCTFCPDRAENSRYQQQSPEEAGREIEKLITDLNPVLLHMLDNAVSPAMMRQLAAAPVGVPWYGFSRFEEDLADLDFCRQLKRSGCAMLKLGLESGSQKVLDSMEKGIRLDRVSRILTNLAEVQIATYTYLLFGTPYETEDDARLTMEFVKKHWRSITFLNLAIFNMPVCSEEARMITDRFSAGDLSLYCDFDHPSGWDRKAVRGFLDRCFRRDPVIQEIIRRDPPFFTSNHAPFFVLAETKDHIFTG